MSNTNNAELATELTIAWLSNPSTRASVDDVKAFLVSMNGAVSALSSSPAAAPVDEANTSYEPAVSVRKSLANPDFIVSMIDGKPYRTFKAPSVNEWTNPAEYRQRYGLKPDYPIVAASYSEARKAMAKKIGLGRKPGQKVGAKTSVEAAGKAVEAKGRAGRGKSVSEARAAAKVHLAGR